MGTMAQRGKGFAPTVSSYTSQDANIDIQCFPANPQAPQIKKVLLIIIIQNTAMKIMMSKFELQFCELQGRITPIQLKAR